MARRVSADIGLVRLKWKVPYLNIRPLSSRP